MVLGGDKGRIRSTECLVVDDEGESKGVAAPPIGGRGAFRGKQYIDDDDELSFDEGR
jgi:hypothetical protein